MTDGTAIGIVSGVGALILVGSAMIARHRAGEPIVRNALIWGVLLIAAFAVARLIAPR